MPSHGNQRELNFCSGLARLAWGQRMAEAYERVLRVAPVADRPAFIQANENWRAWADGFCAPYRNFSGTIAALLFNTCHGKHAAQWSEDLENFAWWYDH